MNMLGCTFWASWVHTCPNSRPKKEPGVCNRNINGLMHRGSYKSEAKSWSNTPLCTTDGSQDMVAVLAPRGAGGWLQEVTVSEGSDVRLAHWLPGKPAEGDILHCHFGKNNH